VLAAKTSSLEAATTRDIATLHIKDVEDQATLAEGEALERLCRAKVENSIVLASAHPDTEGLAWKITLLEGKLVEGH
jgi:hypothetical protein